MASRGTLTKCQGIGQIYNAGVPTAWSCHQSSVHDPVRSQPKLAAPPTIVRDKAMRPGSPGQSVPLEKHEATPLTEGTSQVPRDVPLSTHAFSRREPISRKSVLIIQFQRPTSSASGLSSEEVTISVEHWALSHEAEKHLTDSAVRGWTRQHVGEMLCGAGWSANPPGDCG